MDRRTFLAATGAAGAAGLFDPAMAAAADSRRFPQGFLWGAATAGHQIEGNNVASDVWLLEQVKPTLFAEPSGDAGNGFALWPGDLDLVHALGLNTYRFSLEWARIEPEPGQFSLAMLDHYQALVEGCRARNLTPVVTFNHFTTPRWFAAQGGWTHPDSPARFARFCDRAARHLAAGIGYATTLNEPNTVAIMQEVFPPPMLAAARAMNAAAARACNAAHFANAVVPDPGDIAVLQENLVAGHRQGRAAIKAVRGDLPVGVSLAVSDDQAEGPGSLRDARRKAFYEPWLTVAREDDFLGVQNYARARWNDRGLVPPLAGAPRNAMGQEIYPASLAGAVRHAHAVSGVPILVTEHGVGTPDDAVRAAFIPASLAPLRAAMADGVPVLGYIHWSLIDNFEWIFGYGPKFGLCSLDRTTFERRPKPSAGVLGAIARRNGLD